MLKRFLQNNILLVAVLIVSMVLGVALLAMAALTHMEMREAGGEISRLRDKIGDIQRGQKIAPVEENWERIRKDTEFYAQKVEEAKYLYGRPLDAARDAMAVKLGLKNGSELRKKFLELYESKKSNSTRGQIYDAFKREFGDKWEPAMDEFRKQADVALVEKIDAANQDAILLNQLGIPRNSEGNARLAAGVISGVQERIADLFAKNGVTLSATAGKLAVSLPENADETAIVNTLRLLEISSDLARRIGQSKVASLDEFSVEKPAPEADEEGFVFYCFNVELTGKLENIRTLVDQLVQASEEKRVYVVQSIALERCSDEALKVLDRTYGAAEATAAQEKEKTAGMTMGRALQGRPEDGAATAGKTEAPAMIAPPDESKLAYNERKNYSRPVLGINEYCKAVISIVYVINQEK